MGRPDLNRRRSAEAPPLDSALLARLEAVDAEVQLRDSDRLMIRSLPTNPRYFSKGWTNLLLQRPRAGCPYLMCVDEDLEYEGKDRSLARVFGSGSRERGWHVLPAAVTSGTSLDRSLERAIELLGTEGEAPQWSAPGGSAAGTTETSPGNSLLAGFGRDLAAEHALGRAESTISRQEEMTETLGLLLQRRSITPVLLGPAGVGKTNLLSALSQRLLRLGRSRGIIVVSVAELFTGTLFEAERESLLAKLLDEVGEEVILALEGIERVAAETARGVALLEERIEEGARLLGTSSVATPEALGAIARSRLFGVVVLSEFSSAETLAVLRERGRELAAFHGVEIPPGLLEQVLERARSLSGVLPGKAVSLLDAAACRAALGGCLTTDPLHVELAAATLTSCQP